VRGLLWFITNALHILQVEGSPLSALFYDIIFSSLVQSV